MSTNRNNTVAARSKRVVLHNIHSTSTNGTPERVSAETEIHMRGLDTRVALAHAKILGFLDREAGLDAADEVLFAAQDDGYYDYQAGHHNPPRMFEGEPRLISAWEYGQRAAAGFEMTSNCVECQRSQGNPCSIHG